MLKRSFKAFGGFLDVEKILVKILMKKCIFKKILPED
jgi:hypothetical protein